MLEIYIYIYFFVQSLVQSKCSINIHHFSDTYYDCFIIKFAEVRFPFHILKTPRNERKKGGTPQVKEQAG